MTKRRIVEFAFIVSEVAGIYFAITSSGLVRIIAILVSVPLTACFIIYAWRFIKMLQAWLATWLAIIRTQNKIPKSSLFLFLENMLFVPPSTLATKQIRHSVYTSCGIVSCLLRDIEIDRAKLVVQIPLAIKTVILEIPIDYEIKIKKIGQTTVFKDKEFLLQKDVVDKLEKLYKDGKNTIDITAQLIGRIKGKQNEVIELARATHFTARIKN